MNLSPIILELAVAGLALLILLIDLWTPRQAKARLGYLAAAGLLIIMGISFAPTIGLSPEATAFSGMLVEDGLALFFQRMFLASAIFVVLIGIEYADQIATGIGEFYVIILLALAGMMFAAAVNDFVLLFVALEMISISFYILVSFQRSRLNSLEAGVKYLILSAFSAAILVFGIALIFGVGNRTNFVALSQEGARLMRDKIFWLGAVLVLLGLGFKIASFPLQMWAPDVYQGAPTPITAFLATGSKAAGFVLLLRVLFAAVPQWSQRWNTMLMFAAGITILYGNLCALPQRNLKRLLGYSSISNAGYMLLGIAAVNAAGSAAVLYYFAGYLFTLGAAFAVISIVARENEDYTAIAGLGQRSPFLAATLTLALVSLAGVPPLAGFLGKFLLLKAVLQQAGGNAAYIWLALVGVAGVVISFYYYFSVIRLMYWPADTVNLSPVTVSLPMKVSLTVCILGMLYLGIFPDTVLAPANLAVKALSF